MNILVTGDDEEQISSFVRSIKNKYDPQNINVFEGSFSLSDILNVSQSISIFGGEMLILAHPKSVAQIEFEESFLKELHSKKDIVVLFDLSNINANTGAYKLVKKYADVKAFAKPRDYSLFNVCDAFFMDMDRIKTLKLIDGLDDIESQFFSLLGLMHMSLRNYLSITYKNKTAESIHPFMKSKIAKYKMDPKTVEELYDYLVQMELTSKTKKHDKKAMLQDFVLYFLQ